MPAFDYTALAADGRTLSGRIEAADRGEAARRLQEAGALPVELRPAGTGRAVRAERPAAAIPARDLARLTRGLALLLG
ncbi:type II secretion system protein GspF, partial [Paracraurococcus ruber]|uniref:hypothetical protein n=1 Tax=Paracraurococcus ruber TaxID=77675 RepID=UPI0038D1A4FE